MDDESVVDSDKPKRGRPRKEKVELYEEPKRRGRPPKSTLVISPVANFNQV